MGPRVFRVSCYDTRLPHSVSIVPTGVGRGFYLFIFLTFWQSSKYSSNVNNMQLPQKMTEAKKKNKNISIANFLFNSRRADWWKRVFLFCFVFIRFFFLTCESLKSPQRFMLHSMSVTKTAFHFGIARGYCLRTSIRTGIYSKWLFAARLTPLPVQFLAWVSNTFLWVLVHWTGSPNFVSLVILVLSTVFFPPRCTSEFAVMFETLQIFSS